jgi:hypothetical protein
LVAIAAVDRKDPIAVRTVEAEQFRKGDFAHLVRDWQEQPMWGQLANSRSRIRDFGFQQVVLFREAMHEQDALEAQRILESVLGIPFVESAEVVLWKL